MAANRAPIIASPVIRPIALDDAPDILEMWREFTAHLRSLGDETEFSFDEAAYRENGFGPYRAFDGIVAHVGNEPAGYLLFHFSYDIDRAMRLLYIIELWVRPAMRRHGIGRLLIAETSRLAAEFGAPRLVWCVHNANRPAFDFYASLGANHVTDYTWMYLLPDPG
ncbi:MAG: GNAT family N-acetyltransferase [Rhodospirillaceae bacterium]|nr:GNAT family N-acetyltransferase [Rhodospirillaceae bacterium]